MLLTNGGRLLRWCPACRLDAQVDRKKLKTDKAYVPNWQSAASAGAEEEYEAASTVLEATIQRAWQEVLGQDKISVASDFFQIGGNSLRVSCLCAATQTSAMHWQLTVRTTGPKHGHVGHRSDGAAAVDGSLRLQDCLQRETSCLQVSGLLPGLGNFLLPQCLAHYMQLHGSLQCSGAAWPSAWLLPD